MAHFSIERKLMEEKYTEGYENSASAEITEASEDNSDKMPAKKRAAAEALDWFDTVITSIVAIIVIFALVTRLSTVDGGSMKPTLYDQERLLITDFCYTPQHNDIVVVWTDNLYNELTGEMGEAIVKRVVGLPGDTIRVDVSEGAVYRNGEKLETEEIDGVIYEDGHPIFDYTKETYDMEVTVPDGYVFVMGDNRNNSVDSRDGRVGFVDMNYIIGKAYLRVAPLERFGGLY